MESPSSQVGTTKSNSGYAEYSAVEVDLRVGAIAEGLLARLAATAKRILRLGRVLLPFRIIEGFALGIGDYRLLAERQSALHEVGSVLCDFDLRFRLFALVHAALSKLALRLDLSSATALRGRGLSCSTAEVIVLKGFGGRAAGSK